jgi:uncharacterized protein with ATP-grasp and redox domains
MFRQALNTARVVTDDPGVHLAILQKLARRVADLDLDRTPAILSQPAYELVSEVTGVRDPFAEIKRETNRIALQMLPDLRERITGAADPLDAALHAAVAGNIIDTGIGHEFDIERDVTRMMDEPFAVSALSEFRKELGPGRKLLYLGDNAGEIVFDRLLVEQILQTGTAVTFTVKSAPIINDATMEDAEAAGMTGMVEVIETGSGDIGVNWENASEELRSAFDAADLVLSKGQGNFESCGESRREIYFLLKAKCELVAQELGVALGDTVFKKAV